MADILTSVFRTFMSQTDVNKDVTVVPHLACSALLPGDSSVSSSVLLLGDSSISRSLLLLSAVMAASELGVRVVFFTQTQIQSLPVSLQKCVPSPESLKVHTVGGCTWYDVELLVLYLIICLSS